MPAPAALPVRRKEGVLVEPMGAAWVVFSPASGETLVLNDTAAAVLEILEGGPSQVDAIGRALARDAQVDENEVLDAVESCVLHLRAAGVVGDA